MSKVIRIAVAIVLSGVLGYGWSLILPAGWAMAASLLGGMALGCVAVLWAPTLPGAYHVEVRDEDYVSEPKPAGARWDYPTIRNLNGVSWHDAPAPPWHHECWAQTDGWIGFDHTQRCACGAIRANRFGGGWIERNSRKAEATA